MSRANRLLSPDEDHRNGYSDASRTGWEDFHGNPEIYEARDNLIGAVQAQIGERNMTPENVALAVSWGTGNQFVSQLQSLASQSEADRRDVEDTLHPTVAKAVLSQVRKV